MPGLEDLSDDDLTLIAQGNLDGLSDSALSIIAGESEAAPSPAAEQGLSEQQVSPVKPGKNDPIGQLLHAAGLPPDFLKKSLDPRPLGGVLAAPARAAADPSQLGSDIVGAARSSPELTRALAVGGGATLGAVSPLGPIAGGAAGAALGEAGVEKLLGENIQPGKIVKEAAIQGGLGAAGPTIGAIGKTAAGAAVKKAAGNLGGSIISVLSAIPQRYAQAVSKDSSILSAATPTIKEAGEKYAAALAGAGIKVDRKLLKEVSKSGIPITDSEIGRMKNIVEAAIDAGEAITPGQALIGRQAVAKLRQTDTFARNKNFARSMNEAQDHLDDVLEKSGIPEIKKVSTDYFRAVAKDAFSSVLPKNKNMSPNALRGILMLKQFADAAEQASAGNVIKGGVEALKGIAMSPLAVGGAIRGANALTRGVGGKLSGAGIRIAAAKPDGNDDE